MTRVYLVRHAEAEGNLYRRAHGWYDALITENGYRQIEALERRFADIHVDAVYSSDLFRTKTTASAIWRPKKLELITSKQLREISLGDWEDRTWGQIAYLGGEDLDRFNSMDPEWCVDGAESLQEVRQRVEGAIRHIASRHKGETVVIVSHGCAIRIALGAFHGMTIRESAALGHSDNTAVSLLEFDGDRVRVVFENDNSHLPEEISTLARQQWWKKEGEAPKEKNLWFRPLDVCGEEGEYLLQARRETWQIIYGSSEGFDPEGTLARARKHAEEDEQSILCAMLEDRPVGIIHMDFDRDGNKGIGYISFFYLNEQTRKRGFGIQLLGQAVATYRPMGRNYLRLSCSPENMVAQRFYKRHGFGKIGEKEGSRGSIDLMEKYIGYKDLRE